MAVLMGKSVMPAFDTPDPTVVDKTNPKHPDAQCRMDTSLQGALCSIAFDELLIPGKDTAAGVNSKEAEEQAMKVSCSSLHKVNVGFRPTCWFKSNL